MSQLQTNWIRIASAGNAIDGRVIDERVIKEMAETYNPEEYQARIWPDHRRWFGAWGDVTALKAEEWQGKWRLFAKLRPNSLLMQANEADQKTYCSIEISVKDFDGTGKHYLQALGVTDEPGSLGCEKLKFNIENKGSLYSEPAPFLIEEVAEEEKPTAFRKVMNLFKKDKRDDSPETQVTEETNVEKEQFDQIMAGISGISTKQEDLETRFSALESKQQSEVDTTTEDDASTKTTVETAAAETSENFSKVMEAIQGIASKQEALTEKFNALSQETPGQEPSGQGAADTGYVPV